MLRGPGAPDKKASPPGVEITVTTIAPVHVATNFEKRVIVTTVFLCRSRQALESDRSVWQRSGEEVLGVRRLRIIQNYYCLYCSALSGGDNSFQGVVRTAVCTIKTKHTKSAVSDAGGSIITPQNQLGKTRLLNKLAAPQVPVRGQFRFVVYFFSPYDVLRTLQQYNSI